MWDNRYKIVFTYRRMKEKADKMDKLGAEVARLNLSF